MVKRVGGLLDRVNYRRSLRRWSDAAARAEVENLDGLRDLRVQARALQRHLERVLFVADGRLALPLIGSNAMRKPPNSDWGWRPGVWRGPLPVPGMASVETRTALGEGTTIFHDCQVSELTVRQLRNTRESDLAPFGLRMDVFRFDGTFLSLALNLPPESVQGLRLRHLIRMDAIVETEKPLEIFARLNIKHGPNVEQIVRELPLNAAEAMVEFDLAYSKINEKRIERLWVDLIFEGPEMNQIILRDVTFSRRPRADL